MPIQYTCQIYFSFTKLTLQVTADRSSCKQTFLFSPNIQPSNSAKQGEWDNIVNELLQILFINSLSGFILLF